MDFIIENSKLIGLLFFFSAFLFAGWWAFKPSNKNKMKEYAEIPFKENN